MINVSHHHQSFEDITYTHTNKQIVIQPKRDWLEPRIDTITKNSMKLLRMI